MNSIRHCIALALFLAPLAACKSDKKPPPAAASASTAAATAQTGASTTATAAATAPKPAAKPVASNVPATIEGANTTMGSATVDGLTVKGLSCKTGGGMFGGAAVLSALAKQKDKLHACSSATASPRLHFAWKAKDTSDVRVAGAATAEAARCIADILRATEFPSSGGACILTLPMGPQPAAPTGKPGQGGAAAGK